MPNTNPTDKATPGKIVFEGWLPPREQGLLPSAKANWDGRMLQLFSENLEQAEIDIKKISRAVNEYDALCEVEEALANLVADWERVHGKISDDHEAKATLANLKALREGK